MTETLLRVCRGKCCPYSGMTSQPQLPPVISAVTPAQISSHLHVGILLHEGAGGKPRRGTGKGSFLMKMVSGSTLPHQETKEEALGGDSYSTVQSVWFSSLGVNRGWLNSSTHCSALFRRRLHWETPPTVSWWPHTHTHTAFNVHLHMSQSFFCSH